MVTPNEEERIEKIIAKAVDDLQEAGCDAVQILASYRSDRSTAMAAGGSGNWYARVGMANEFIDKERAEKIAKAMEDGK